MAKRTDNTMAKRTDNTMAKRTDNTMAKRTDNTMAKRKDTTEQTTIYNTQNINDRAKRTPLKPGGFQHNMDNEMWIEMLNYVYLRINVSMLIITIPYFLIHVLIPGL